MPRTTKTITISLPPEMESEVQEIMRAEGRTRSELFREALRRYVEARRLSLLSREISRKAAEAGITSENDIAELIHDQRRKAG